MDGLAKTWGAIAHFAETWRALKEGFARTHPPLNQISTDTPTQTPPPPVTTLSTGLIVTHCRGAKGCKGWCKPGCMGSDHFTVGNGIFLCWHTMFSSDTTSLGIRDSPVPPAAPPPESPPVSCNSIALAAALELRGTNPPEDAGVEPDDGMEEKLKPSVLTVAEGGGWVGRETPGREEEEEELELEEDEDAGARAEAAEDRKGRQAGWND